MQPTRPEWKEKIQFLTEELISEDLETESIAGYQKWKIFLQNILSINNHSDKVIKSKKVSNSKLASRLKKSFLFPRYKLTLS